MLYYKSRSPHGRGEYIKRERGNMKNFVIEEYHYNTDDEKNTILLFLEALYGNYYCSGFGNITIDRDAQIITTRLLK